MLTRDQQDILVEGMVKAAAEKAIIYRNLLLEKLDGSVPPPLLALIWGCSAAACAAVCEKAGAPNRVQERLKGRVGDDFWENGFSGFSGVTEQEFTAAYTLYEDAYRDAKLLFSDLTKAGGKRSFAQVHKGWAEKAPTFQEAAMEDRNEAMAVISTMGVVTDSLALAEGIMASFKSLVRA